MAMKDVKLVLDKAHKDDNFRKMLLENPDEALRDFSLSDREKSKFKGIGQEQLMAFKSQLDKRFSKDGSAGGDDDWWVESVTD
ncbi:Os1348 family NHLP clan protein [Bacteriovoracales bacterium]|nr:Os1348 family NHLP clan protein [Bacteriovoracales bacterium]